MRSHRRTAGAVGLSLVALLASGCGARSAASTTGDLLGASAPVAVTAGRTEPLPHSGVVYHGTDTTTLRLDPSLGFVLAPPGPAVEPRSTWHVAYATCGHGSACPSGAGPDIYLTLLTDTNGDLAAGPSSSEISHVRDRLVYLMVWYGQPCPAPAGPVPAMATGDSLCTMHAEVDADTADALGGGSGPS